MSPVPSLRPDPRPDPRPARPPLRAAALLAAALVLYGPCHAAETGDAAVAKRCFKCHGEDGLDTSAGEPVIAGQPAAFIISALERFRGGDRPAKEMRKPVKNLTREEMDAVARYFSTRPNKLAAQPFDPVLAQKGEGIHSRLCEKCHEDGGRGFRAKVGPGPVLAGQSAKYLNDQFGQFMSMDREMPRDMGGSMLELRSGDAEALVNYYLSLGSGS